MPPPHPTSTPSPTATPNPRATPDPCFTPDLRVTVAICAHNAEPRLDACLHAISLQITDPIVRDQWEVLVIDNASTDRTSALADAWRDRLPVPLRILREDRPGVMWARTRAAREARGRLIAWVDDDNLIERDFVSAVDHFFTRHPRCAIAGGRAFPAFEDPATRPPDFDVRFADALACRDHGPLPFRRVPPHDDPPFAAGSAGRTDVLRLILLDIGCQLTGRLGNRLLAGEDTEIGLLAHHLGWEIWHAPGLTMRHVMPPRRLTPPYLDQIITGGARGQAWLDLLRTRHPPRHRWHYIWQAARLEASALKFTLLRALRPHHPHHHRYAFWRDLYHNRAAGFLDLALHNPWPTLRNHLQALRSQLHPLALSPSESPPKPPTPTTILRPTPPSTHDTSSRPPTTPPPPITPPPSAATPPSLRTPETA